MMIVIPGGSSGRTANPKLLKHEIMETLTMQETEGGQYPGHDRPQERVWTGLELAKHCGYSDARWTRRQRADLEEMLLKCKNGKELVAKLKTEDDRYTDFAFQLITEKQRLTGTAVPVLKDGKPVLDKSGKAKLQNIERKMLPWKYEELLVAKYGKASEEELLEADSPGGQGADSPGGSEEVDEVEAIEGELLEEDPEMVSTAIVFETKDRSSEIEEIQANTLAIVEQTRSTFQSFRQNLLKSFEEQGRRDALTAMQAYNRAAQEVMNQNLSDLSESGSPEEKPKTTRRTTRKKSV